MFEILFFCTLILLLFSIYFNIKFGILILKIEDTIEECLDQLDEKYQVFSKILEKPVFFDSLEIRQVIHEIRSSQDLLLLIANKLSNFGRDTKDETKEQ